MLHGVHARGYWNWHRHVTYGFSPSLFEYIDRLLEENKVESTFQNETHKQTKYARQPFLLNAASVLHLSASMS